LGYARCGESDAKRGSLKFKVKASDMDVEAAGTVPMSGYTKSSVGKHIKLSRSGSSVDGMCGPLFGTRERCEELEGEGGEYTSGGDTVNVGESE